MFAVSLLKVPLIAHFSLPVPLFNRKAFCELISVASISFGTLLKVPLQLLLVLI